MRRDKELHVKDVCYAASNLLQLSWSLMREEKTNDVVPAVEVYLFNSAMPVFHLPVIFSKRRNLHSRIGNGLRKLGSPVGTHGHVQPDDGWLDQAL